MTHKEFIKQCNRVKRLWKKWEPLLGLSHYDVKLHFYKNVFEDDEFMEAWAHASWEYVRADLHFSIPHVMRQDDAELEETVVHEAAHIIVKQLQDWSTCDCDLFNMKFEEKVVTDMARAFIRTHKAVR